jgi:hypothetical protein
LKTDGTRKTQAHESASARLIARRTENMKRTYRVS